MALTPLDDRREFLLGSGAAAGSLLVGILFAGVAVTGRIDAFQAPALALVLVLVALAYGIAGLYDIVALGIPKRGVAHLVSGAGIVLALLGPYGASSTLFVASGALALLVSASYHAALLTDVLSATEEPAADLESDGGVR